MTASIEHDLSTVTLQKSFGNNGGVTLRRLAGNPKTNAPARIIVTHVGEHAASAGLQVGQHVKSINNIEAHLMLSEASAQDVVVQSELVTFLVEPPLPAMGLITANITKSAAHAAGMIINLEENEQKQVCVGAAIAPASGTKKGKTGNTTLTSVCPSLKPGMRILSVNNTDCTERTSSQVAQLFTHELSQKHINVNANHDILTVLAVADPFEAHEDAYKYTTISVAASSEASLGVTLVNSFHTVDWSKQVLIKSIDKSSVFFGTGLRVGMELVSVNGIDCTVASGASAKSIMTILQDLEGSPITLLAQQARHLLPGSLFTVTLTKEAVTDKLGVGLGLGEESNMTTVKTIKDGSLASLTTLEIGMFVLSINNKNCANDQMVASQIIAESVGPVVFLVQTPGPKTYDMDASQMVTATIRKTNKSDKVGCTLVKQGGDIIIGKLFHNTLAHFTDLKVGMKLHKINNMDCVKLGLVEAQKLMTGTNLELLAEKPQLAPGHLVAAAITCADSLGMSIAQTSDRSMPYIISKISDGGLVAQTDLQTGFLLKAVNNVDCTQMKSLEELSQLLATKERPLTILASTPGDCPIKHTKLLTTMVPIAKGSVQKGSLVLDEATGTITVSEVGAKGFLYGSPLRIGMKILSLNNVPAKQFTKSSLNAYLNAQDFVIIVAQKKGLKMGVLMTEVLHRPHANMPIGIGIKQFREKLYISSIRDASLASTTRLMPGMEILSIDNEECRGMEKAEFARISREAVGDILIVATTQKKSFFDKSADPSLVSACFDKATSGKAAKVGLTLAQKEGKLVITKISGNSLAAGSDLTIGMNVVAINDEDAVGMSIEDALARFAATRGHLTILAKRPMMAPGSFVTASIVKDSHSVGIRLGLNDDGLVTITHIAPLLAASFTDLTQGMVVEAVNGVKCSTMKLKEVNALFANSNSIITILARTTADISVGRASFKSTRSLASNRSILSRSNRESERSFASQESRESAECSFASDGNEPVVTSARAAPDGNDPATMDRVAPSPAKTIVHQQQRSSPVPALVSIESRDGENSAWC